MNLQATAEKHGLHEQSPYKEMLAFNRMLTLVQAEWNDGTCRSRSRPSSRKSITNEHPTGTAKLRRRLIYIPFASGWSEDEAKAKAEKVVQQARGGVDFVKLVKEYSQDSASAAQNGDIGMPVRKYDNTNPGTHEKCDTCAQAGSGQRSLASPERLLRIQGRIGWRLTVRESQRRDLQRAERRGFQPSGKKKRRPSPAFSSKMKHSFRASSSKHKQKPNGQ